MNAMIDPLLWLLFGMVLIFLEFFLPGGILGIIGAISLIVSIVLFANIGFSPLVVGLYILSVLLLGIGLVRFALWFIRRSGKKNTIRLDQDQTGYVASSYDMNLIGKEGFVETDLKPGGKIVVDELEYQAISEMGYLPKGTKILVIRGEGADLIVKTLE